MYTKAVGVAPQCLPLSLPSVVILRDERVNALRLTVVLRIGVGFRGSASHAHLTNSWCNSG